MNKVSTEFQGMLTLDSENILVGKIDNNSTNQFYVRKLNVKQGEIWYARAYLIYEDSDGNVITTYSKVTSKGQI
ncbi:hypothetical protein RBH29_13055 [Herbivorax sp. ANBcel31]|uniref:hypothetical protein n=1 Tax=Herbivorax sp. ANBcel31 TaxID=3069754 RepID=UPI0027B853FE|nr:hypothetical protein [Herbivorax sp. ANBcel31]MDQ2087354.1 hypothetical protein [Herbivorax sp. ANBcel31]